MIALIAALLTVQGGMTVENPGIRLELFLKEVSKQSSTNLHCSPFLRNEVLAVSFQNQSLDILKTQLARVIHGTWESRKDGWWLVQTGKQQIEERNWNFDQHRAVTEFRLKQLAAYAPTQEWLPNDAEKVWVELKKLSATNNETKISPESAEKLIMTRPENRLVARVAKLLRPEQFPLEGLDHEYRRLSPTPIQDHIKIPIDVSSALNQFRSEYQMFEQVRGKKEDDWQGAINMEIRGTTSEIPEFNLYLYDKNWRYVTSCWASLDLTKEPFIAKGEAFPLSQTTQALFNFSDRLNEDRYDRTKDVEFKKNPLYGEGNKVLNNATVTDPLGLLQGPCWIDFAKSQRKPLLVNLEEESYQTRPPKFVPIIEQNPVALGMQRIDADNWILGRPKNPLYNRTWRLDRSVIEEFSKLVASPESATLEAQIRLDDYGRYAWQFGHGVPNSQYMVGYDYRGNGPFCILGTLSNEQLRACLNGDDIGLNQLPERAKAYLLGLMSNGNLDELSPLLREGEPSTPAYCFPNGLPPIQLTAKETDITLFSFSNDPQVYGREIQSFAWQMKNAIEKSSEELNQTFYMWKARSLTAEIRLGNRSVKQNASERVRTNPLAYTWATLPGTIKDQVISLMKTPG